ncbi:MAG: sulfotransferase domain-containing protein [Alphaproteobacteria bacterium]
MSGLSWLASYPKSGNTWLRLALASLRRGGGAVDINETTAVWDASAYSRRNFDRALDIEASDLTPSEILCARPEVFRTIAARVTGPAIWKAHEACLRTPAGEPLFPPEATAAAVYIVRDPRDVVPSLAHHLTVSIDRAIAFLNDPEAVFSPAGSRLPPHLTQPLLTWSRHVESWLDEAPFPICLLRYEDMRVDPVAGLHKVAKTFGIEAGEAALAGAVEATRFEVLREQEARHGFRERPAGVSAFFRRGEVGGWRDTLTPAQVARIERDHGAVMDRLGYRGCLARDPGTARDATTPGGC